MRNTKNFPNNVTFKKIYDQKVPIDKFKIQDIKSFFSYLLYGAKDITKHTFHR